MRAVIVPNFDDNGGVLGGLLKKQNALEAGVFLGLGMMIFFISLSSISSLVISAVIFFFTMLGTSFFAIGIGDESVVKYLIMIIKYKAHAGTAVLMMPSNERHY